MFLKVVCFLKKLSRKDNVYFENQTYNVKAAFEAVG